MATSAHTQRFHSGVEGFDDMAMGGLPAGRCSLLCGVPGSGKTVFALQMLAAGARRGERGVLVTFEESREDLLRNAASFGWQLAEHVERGAVIVLDYSVSPTDDVHETTELDPRGLRDRITAVVQHANARCVVLDGIGALVRLSPDPVATRLQIARVAGVLRELEVNTIVTADHAPGTELAARDGVDELPADNIVLLRNDLRRGTRRRTVEILKVRGAPHRVGEVPFTIDPDDGIATIPGSVIDSRAEASDERVTVGIRSLDGLLGGGVWRDSIVLVSGPTGTGKTLLAGRFARGAMETAERAIYFSFEESVPQLVRNARSYGTELEDAPGAELVRKISRYPARLGLEDLLLEMKREIACHEPRRVMVDSLSALRRGVDEDAFHEFVVGLTSHMKSQQIAAVLTTTEPLGLSMQTPTETGVSTIADTVVMLRYLELEGVLRRGIAVLKHRGSEHARDIHEYEVTDAGFRLVDPLREYDAILSGAPRRLHAVS